MVLPQRRPAPHAEVQLSADGLGGLHLVLANNEPRCQAIGRGQPRKRELSEVLCASEVLEKVHNPVERLYFLLLLLLVRFQLV